MSQTPIFDMLIAEFAVQRRPFSSLIAKPPVYKPAVDDTLSFQPFGNRADMRKPAIDDTVVLTPVVANQPTSSVIPLSQRGAA